MDKKLKDVDQYIKEAIENIENDRAVTSNLLTDLMVEIKQSSITSEAHKDLGQIAAKYVETLQRSNEQLVKITALLQKKTSQIENVSLSSEDKEDLFDIIQEGAK